MVARTRVRDRWIPKGTRTFFGTVYHQGDYVRAGFDICRDQVLPGDNHPFTVDKFDFSGGVCNGSNNGWIVFSNYTVDAAWTDSNWDIHDILDSPSIEAVATTAAAKSNPSAPYVDVPVALFELGDIALLLKNSGDNLISKAGGTNLKYQFGIAPLVGDILKLMDFQDEVDRRVKALQKLVAKREYRKTVRVWAGEQVTYHHKYLQSQGCFIHNTFEVTTRKLMWAHCRWVPTPNFDPLMSSDAMRGLAKRATLGLKLDFVSAWELMPWSWLIDWCTNFGEFLTAHRNLIPATLGSVTVSTHTQSVHTCGAASDGPIHMSSIRVVRERKQRQIASVAPVAHFPFLNGRQVGILASLSVTRR